MEDGGGWQMTCGVVQTLHQAELAAREKRREAELALIQARGGRVVEYVLDGGVKLRIIMEVSARVCARARRVGAG